MYEFLKLVCMQHSEVSPEFSRSDLWQTESISTQVAPNTVTLGEWHGKAFHQEGLSASERVLTLEL